MLSETFKNSRFRATQKERKRKNWDEEVQEIKVNNQNPLFNFTVKLT